MSPTAPIHLIPVASSFRVPRLLIPLSRFNKRFRRNTKTCRFVPSSFTRYFPMHSASWYPVISFTPWTRITLSMHAASDKGLKFSAGLYSRCSGKMLGQCACALWFVIRWISPYHFFPNWFVYFSFLLFSLCLFIRDLLVSRALPMMGIRLIHAIIIVE